MIVNRTTYANGRQPTFVGTATPGAKVDLVLSGKGVIGAKKIGTVVADASGHFKFRLPRGIKNGRYVLLARGRQPDGSAVQVSTPLSFKLGPVPRVRRPVKAVKAPRTRKVTPIKKAAQAHHPTMAAHHVRAASHANGHVVDQAVHALAQARPLFKKKGH